MELSFVYRLPATWQGVGNLGGLSRDTASTLSVVGLCRVLTTAICKEQCVCGGARLRLHHGGQLLRELDP
eukprot:276875-Amphidinium_carterae.1